VGRQTGYQEHVFSLYSAFYSEGREQLGADSLARRFNRQIRLVLATDSMSGDDQKETHLLRGHDIGYESASTPRLGIIKIKLTG
jgi:hypothetical protein